MPPQPVPAPGVAAPLALLRKEVGYSSESRGSSRSPRARLAAPPHRAHREWGWGNTRGRKWEGESESESDKDSEKEGGRGAGEGPLGLGGDVGRRHDRRAGEAPARIVLEIHGDTRDIVLEIHRDTRDIVLEIRARCRAAP